MDLKSIPILVMGCGAVGRRLLHLIVSCRANHLDRGLIIRVVGVSNSKSLITSTDPSNAGLPDALLMAISGSKNSAESTLPNEHGQGLVFEGLEANTKLLEIPKLLARTTGLVVVDCTSTSETLDILKRVVELGCCIVLANKIPLTSRLDDYQKLVSSPRRVRYNVGVGLPVVSSITNVVATGNSVRCIIGSLSGVLGYVMSEVEDGQLFSKAVQAAKHLGYTNPDPRDDLNGIDVARKALILARLLGQQINMDDLKIESLYPNELGPDSMSTEDFLSMGLPSLDKDIIERVKVASSNGNVLRYVCTIEGSRCQVGLQELSKYSALGRLRGSETVVEISIMGFKETPLVIQGAGERNDTMAAGVLADIIDLENLFT